MTTQPSPRSPINKEKEEEEEDKEDKDPTLISIKALCALILLERDRVNMRISVNMRTGKMNWEFPAALFQQEIDLWITMEIKVTCMKEDSNIRVTLTLNPKILDITDNTNKPLRSNTTELRDIKTQATVRVICNNNLKDMVNKATTNEVHLSLIIWF
jgi:hypothetical protein